QEGDTIRVLATTQPRSADARAALEELRLFVESRFGAGPTIFTAAEWDQLLGKVPATLPERLLLLARLAIAGNSKVVISGIDDTDATLRFTPNDRGLEKYVSKFASLPDGTPFSLRLLLTDKRGKKKAQEEEASAWNQLPWAIKLEVLGRILAGEA